MTTVLWKSSRDENQRSGREISENLGEWLTEKMTFEKKPLEVMGMSLCLSCQLAYIWNQQKSKWLGISVRDFLFSFFLTRNPLFAFWDSPGYPGTHSVDQAGLKLKRSWELRLKGIYYHAHILKKRFIFYISNLLCVQIYVIWYICHVSTKSTKYSSIKLKQWFCGNMWSD